MTDAFPGQAELLREKAALEARLAALQATIAEQEQIAADLRAAQVREDHIRQVLLAIRDVNQLIVHEDDPLRLIEGTCTTLAEARGYPAAWIALLDRASGRATATAFSGDSAAMEGLRERLADGDLPRCVRQAMERDEVVAIDQPGSECADCFVAATFPQSGRLLSRLSSGDQVYGVLAVVLPTELAHDAEEQDIIREVAGDIGFALSKMAVREQQLSLEREQAYLLRSMVDAFAVYRSIFDDQGRLVSYRFEYINEAYELATGARLEQVWGKTIYEVWPDTEPGWLENYAVVVDGGAPLSFEMYDGGVGRTFRCTAYRPWDSRDRFCVVFTDITAQRHAEAQLRAGEERFRAIAEQLSDCIYVTSLDGIITYISPAAQAIFGRSPADMVGRHFATFLAPSSYTQATRIFQDVVALGERIKALELEMTRADGSTFIGELDGTRFHIGEEHGTLGVLRDITARKRAERETEESRLLLRAVIDLIPDPVFAKDAAGRKILTNPRDVAVSGATSEAELLGKSDHDYYPGELAGRFEANDMAVMQEGKEIINAEMQFDMAGGRPTWWLVSKVPLRDAAGRIVGLVGVSHEITAQKLAEQESERNRQLLRTVIDLLPDAIYVKDEAARKILLNRADLDNLEVEDEADVIGKTDLELFDPDTASGFYADDLRVLHTGQAIRNREELLLSPSGRQRKVLLTSKVPLRADDGTIVGLVGIGHDITERKMAQEEVERSRHLLRTVIDLLPSAVYVKDTEARTTLSNLANTNAIGPDESAVLGKTDLELYPSETAERTYADDLLVLHDGRAIIDREEPMTLPSGEKRWGLTTKVPLRDPDGQIIGLVGIGHNITSRKLAQLEIERARILLRTVIDLIPDPISVKDASARKILANRAEVAVSELCDESEILGKTEIEVLGPEIGTPFYEHDLTMLQDGRSLIDLEWMKETTNGEKLWYLISKVPLRDADGSITGIVGIGHDITERKRAEEAVRASEELMRYIVKHDPSAIAVLDRDMRYVFVSDRYLHDYGVAEADVIGQVHYDVIPDIPQRWRDVHQRCLAGAVERDEDDHFVRLDGSITYNSWECRPWYRADGEIGGIIIYTEITTERKLAEQALRQANADLERSQMMADLGSWHWNVATDHLQWSDQMYRLFGIAPSDFPGTADDVVENAVHPEDRAAVGAWNEMLRLGRQPEPMEYRIVRQDGSVRTLWGLVGDISRDEAGRIISVTGIAQDITERRRVEEALRESEVHFRTLANSGQALIWTSDTSGACDYFNQPWLDFTGRALEQELGSGWAEGVHPDDLDRSLATYHHAFEHRERFSMVYRLRRHDGVYRWVQDGGSPRYDSHGRFLGYIGHCLDISAQIEAVAAARASEERFRLLIEGAPQGIFVQTDRRFAYVNAAAAAMLGERADELIGQQVVDHFAPVSRDLVSQRIHLLNDERQSVPMVMETMLRRDGTTFEVDILAVPISYDGKHGALAFFQDVTAREQAAEALRQSEAMYRSLIAGLPDIVLRTDRQGRFLFASENVTAISSLPARQFLGRTAPELGFPAEMCTAWDAAITAVFETGGPLDSESTHMSDMGVRRFEWRQVPEYDGQGQVQAVLTIARDVTAQRQAEERLQETLHTSDDIVRAIPSGLLIYRWEAPDRLILVSANPEAERMMGIGSNCYGQEYSETWPDEADATCKSHYLDVVRNGEIYETAQLDYEDHHLKAARRIRAFRLPGNRLAIAFEDVTELRRAEQELRQSESVLQRIFDVLPVGLWFADRDGTLLRGNAAGVAIWGAEPHVSPKDYGVFKARRLPSGQEITAEDWALARTIREGVTVTDELLEIDAFDGQKKVIVNYTAPVLDEQGHVEAAIVVNQDVTGPVRITEALQRSEALYRHIFEDHSAVKLLIDPETGQIIDANHAAVAYYGWSRDELRQKKIQDINTRPSSEADQEMDRAVAQDRVQFEYRHRRADGSIRDVEVYSSRIEVEGRPLLHSIVHDITDRKQAEAALAESERNYRTFVDSTTDMVYVKDQSFRYVLVNEAYRAFLGHSVEGIVGHTDFELMPLEMAQMCRASDERALAHHGVMVAQEQVGDDVFETRKFPVVQPDDGLGIGAFIRDVTEQLRSEQETARLEEQLRQAQKMESVGRLAGGVAHDFNNMLGVILGHTELALEQVAVGQPLRDDLHEIQRAAQRSADLTRQLLAFARKQTVAPRVLDLNETVAGMLKMLRRLIGEDIDLAWLPGAALWPVRIDPVQVDQILANLCVNARDAIDGTGKLTIETDNVSFDEAYCADHLDAMPGDYVRLAVSDDGRGMDAETLAHLFEPFFTTKPVGEGTGLGLATIHGIVRQNEGFINVYSEPGQGTTFRIYLPRCATTPDTAAQAARPPISGGGETILLVEDEPAILKMGKTMLERLGYRVLGAASPADALQLAAEHASEIHLLMTDVVMPSMNGRELATRLRALCPEIKCLFMSGYTANVIAHHGVLDEGVHFIQKPFSVRELAAQVRATLAGD